MIIDLSKNLFNNWNNLNINYCHWKSNEHLLEGLNGNTDLDVLVDILDHDKVEDCLKDMGFMKCKSQYGSRYPLVDDWLGVDEDTGIMIHLHLHYRIITGHKGMKEYELPWNRETLETRVKDEATNVYMMNPDLELMTLYTRIGLKASINRKKLARNGIYKTDDDELREISWLKKKSDLSRVKSYLSTYYKEDGKMLEIIQTENISSKDFLRLASITSKEFAKNRPYGSLVAVCLKYYYAIALRLVKFIRNRMDCNIIVRKTPNSDKGVIVAFIGQDGAGKSTVSENIYKWLSWKLDAKKFYLGSGGHYSSWQKKIRYKLAPYSKGAIKALRALLALSDYVSLAKNVRNTIVTANGYARKGGIAIFDRYPQIVYAGINDGPKIRSNFVPKIGNPLIRKYALWCAAKEEKYLKEATTYVPNIVFKLILPPEESIRRKPEENIEMVRRKHEIIRSLKFDNAEVHTIDATMDYCDEIRTIKCFLWKKIKKS